MKSGLTPGKRFDLRVRVTTEMCPHFDGELLHPVYATWSLAHDMEVAGRKLLEPYLEPDEEGIGAHISIDHRSPALVGSEVLVRAEVEHCSPRQLTCVVAAWCGPRELARGKFVQVILSRARLEEALDRLRREQAESQ